MKSKVLCQGFWPLILMATFLILFTSCKKKEDTTTTNNLLTGIWSGTLSINDPSVGHWVDYTMTIDFDRLTGSSTCYRNGQIVGSVKKITSSTIEVDWPSCNYEVVSYSISSGRLIASGNQTAYSDGRIIPSDWNLTKQ